MNIRAYIPVYAATLLVSAALLFSVQPMFSKMILPLLGGTPQVWNTAMLFFQATLLGGYAYAHGTSRFLSIRVQAIVHITLLLICLIFLPLAIPDGSIPPTDSDPTLWQLSLMAVTVGGPFFVIAGSAPMFQRWFSVTPHPDANNPYFLYGASNLGSMTSLLSYPFIIDPLLGLNGQSIAWSIGYGVLIILTAAAAFLAISGQKTVKTSMEEKKEDKETLTWKLRLTWLFWAFIPSSMMLGVTTYITTDIATAPLLWIVPLALYVGSFIIVFAREEVISNRNISKLMFIGLCCMLLLSLAFSSFVGNPFIITGVHFTFFFIAAVACHKRLADLRPKAQNLTEFYLLMSVGGVLGGFFNAIIAPQFFVSPIEYPIMICLACFARYSWEEKQSFASAMRNLKDYFSQGLIKSLFNEKLFIPLFIVGSALFLYTFVTALMNVILGVIIVVLLIDSYDKRWLSGVLVSLLILLFPPGAGTNIENSTLLHQERNFFGIIRVFDIDSKSRILLHGTTNHGVQALDENYKLYPLSYYGEPAPLKDVISLYDDKITPQNFALIGLGIGGTACYQKDGRHFDFFEIDPSIAKIAQDDKFFTFLRDCGSDYDIILGDGRLTIQQQPDNKYDVLFLDAFSSDSIPVHLITKEAIDIYLSKLKNDGVLIFHISNRHLDLEPVLKRASEEFKITSLARVSLPEKLDDTGLDYYPTHYVILTNDEDKISTLKGMGWEDAIGVAEKKLWTDQYSNILSAFGHKTTKMRMDKAIKAHEAAKKAEEEKDAEALNSISDPRTPEAE